MMSYEFAVDGDRRSRRRGSSRRIVLECVTSLEGRSLRPQHAVRYRHCGRIVQSKRRG